MMVEGVFEELERRVRTVEEELVGERHVSRFVVEQTTRNGEIVNALRAEVAQLRADIAAARVDVNSTGMRVDILAGDGAAIKAALAMHGRALDVLQQDVRQLRGDMTELRNELRGEMSEQRGEMNRRLGVIEQTVVGDPGRRFAARSCVIDRRANSQYVSPPSLAGFFIAAAIIH